MVSHKCSECSFVTKRSDNSKQHLKNVHDTAKKTIAPIKSSNEVRHLGDGWSRRRPRPGPGDGLYTEDEFEEIMGTLRGRFPTMNFNTIDPRSMHPFIIAGLFSSGKLFFCMRLIRNARECIAPPPERIVYCYSVYQQ